VRKVKRWRYFCDHCKKSGGSAPHMLKHERGCTANPQRVCGVCSRIGLSAAPLAELVALVKSVGKPEHNEYIDYSWWSLDQTAFQALREKADNCPCCILAALRQGNGQATSDVTFDFRKEIKDVWKGYDDDAYQERMGSYYGGY
jgi:hypothetical protein